MNPAQQQKIYIQANDHKGESYNLTVKGWSELTGKSQESIRNAYRKKKNGERDLNNRQVVGLEDIDYITRDRQKAARKKQILNEKELLTRDFLNKRLVPCLN